MPQTAIHDRLREAFARRVGRLQDTAALKSTLTAIQHDAAAHLRQLEIAQEQSSLKFRAAKYKG